MGLRIATNTSSETVQRNLRRVSNEIDSSLNRLSSGKRITQAGDDAAGLAVSTSLDAEIKGLRQATRNTNDGISLIQVTEGSLNEISNMLVRLREISIQAASDTIGDPERGFLNKEYQQLVTEIDRISKSSTFKSLNILDGRGAGVLSFQVGANAGDENIIQFDSGEAIASSRAIGVSGTGVEDKGDALSAIADIDDAIQNISGQKASLGSIQSRLQSTAADLETQILTQTNALSKIQDTDVAYEASKLTSGNIVKSAGISTLLQSNRIHNEALRLIS